MERGSRYNELVKRPSRRNLAEVTWHQNGICTRGGGCNSSRFMDHRAHHTFSHEREHWRTFQSKLPILVDNGHTLHDGHKSLANWVVLSRLKIFAVAFAASLTDLYPFIFMLLLL